MPWLYRTLAAALLCLAASGYAEALVHKVKRGENLSTIARRYGVSTAQIRHWNKLRSDKILVGQRLQVRTSASRSKSYVVRRGDTVSEIAQRFGVSVSQLRSLNNLRRDRIYPGQRLVLRSTRSTATHRVRRGDTLGEIAQAYSTSVGRLRQLNNLKSHRITSGQVLKVSESAGGRPRSAEEPLEYTVRKGDTLTGISRRFDVGLGLLRQLNNLKSDRIHPGQRLKLRPTELDVGVHIVRSGETLSGIAQRYGIKMGKLRDLNGIVGSRILVGQKLRLKSTPTATHIVERGDALWEIARAYGMRVSELKAMNGLSSNRIYPGQELKLNFKKARRHDVYRVERGDYLSEIARLHQMSVAELKRINNLRSSVIHPGDRLKVKPLLGRGKEWLKVSEINWDKLQVSLGGIRKIRAENGPYYYSRPKARRQKHSRYYEGHPSSPLRTYNQARKLWKAFEREVDGLGRLSNTLRGWHLVLDPGHGGLDPGAVVRTLDGQGNKLYVVEDEYVYDIALRTYVLLRLHGAQATMTLLSPNHLIRSSPPSQTFVNEKNEVYNSYQANKTNRRRDWPRGSNLAVRVRIARHAFANTTKSRRIFLSFHADIDPKAPEAPLVLYYESRNGRKRDLASRNFARILLPALGAGSRLRGQGLGVLRNNPAAVKVLVELRNLAYTDHAWALRYEQLRHRDAEKLVKGILDYVRYQTRSARR